MVSRPDDVRRAYAYEALVDDFYDRVSRLRNEPELDPTPLLEEALGLIVLLADARLAYLELRSSQGTPFVRGHGCNHEDLEAIEKSLSRTIIDRVLTSGEAVILDNPLQDVRFADASSVKQNQIQQVIALPLGQASCRGVVYLQGKPWQGLKATIHKRLATFARELGPVMSRLLNGPPPLADDLHEAQRRRILEALRRRRWNYSEAAAELQISRSHLYRLIASHAIERPR